MQVEKLIDTANNIEDTGVASAYDEEFENMEKILEETKKKLSDANVSKEHIEQLDNEVTKLKKEVRLLFCLSWHISYGFCVFRLRELVKD